MTAITDNCAEKNKRQVYLLTLPGVHLLDLAAPGQIFGHDWLRDQVELHYISTDSELRCHQGLMFSQLEACQMLVRERVVLAPLVRV